MPITPVFGGSSPALVPPGTPAPVALVAGSTALASTFIGSWSDAVTVTASVSVDDASPAPTATVTGSGAGPYSVAIASGLGNGRVYAVTLSGQDSFGQFAEVTLSVAVATAGAGPGAVWLDMPTVVVNATDIPAVVPASVQWPEPTNGTGPYVYEVTFVMNGQSNLFSDYNLTTRTLYYTQANLANTNNVKNALIRVKATDSVGNYGYCYLFFFRANVTSASVYILPEIVLDEADPASTYTFPPVVAGAVGRKNTDVNWSHVYGNGKLSENPMYLADADAGGGSGISRYMGPFKVDPAAGSVLIMVTPQESASGALTYMAVQPFRRRRANSYGVGGPYMTIADYNLQTLGAGDPSAFTVPLTGTVQQHYCDFAPAPGETDFFQMKTNQSLAGGPATVEVSSLNANGQTLELQTVASNSRTIQSTIQAYVWPTKTNTATRRPNRCYIASQDSEFVWRWHGRMEIGTAGGGVSWWNSDGPSTAGGGGVVLRVSSSAPPGATSTTLVQVRGRRANGEALIGAVPASELLGRDIGVDVIGSGVQRVTYLYQWTGSFPDLTADRPYEGYKYWVFEGDAEATNETSFVAGDLLAPFSQVTYAASATQLAFWYQSVSLGSVANNRVFSQVYRVAMMARPRPIQRNFR
jgi:hypothetical protein